MWWHNSFKNGTKSLSFLQWWSRGFTVLYVGFHCIIEGPHAIETIQGGGDLACEPSLFCDAGHIDLQVLRLRDDNLCQ